MRCAPTLPQFAMQIRHSLTTVDAAARFLDGTDAAAVPQRCNDCSLGAAVPAPPAALSGPHAGSDPAASTRGRLNTPWSLLSPPSEGSTFS